MIVAAQTENIEKAAQLLRSGEVIAFPTETVYGLGGDALNPMSAARIFAVKNRPAFDPLIVHVDSFEMAAKVALVPESGIVRDLMKAFWPGPLTIILPKRECVPPIVTSGLDTVAVRMPGNEVALELIRRAGCPVAAPSANPFGYLSPTTAGHVEEQIGSLIPLVLDGGPCRVGVESTIVRVVDEKIEVLRPGGVATEDLAEATGREVIVVRKSVLPVAPGMMEYHYSPLTPLVLIEEGASEPFNTEGGYIAFRNMPAANFQQSAVLSSNGSLEEAAAAIFAALHTFDSAGLPVIYVETVPETGLGLAIMNRLRKAAARR